MAAKHIRVDIPFELRDTPFARLAKRFERSTWTNGRGDVSYTIDTTRGLVHCDDVDCCQGGPHSHVDGPGYFEPR